MVRNAGAVFPGRVYPPLPAA